MKGGESVQLLLSAGEASGDAILSCVLEKLIPRLPPVSLFGVAGEKSEKFGLKSLVSLNSISANGLIDIWAHFHKYVYIYLCWRRKTSCVGANNSTPVLAILVDFPGLNKVLLRLCLKKKIPVYYISPPQTWPYKNKNINVFLNCHVQVAYPMDLKAYEKVTSHVCFGHFQSTPPAERWNSNAKIKKTGPHYLICPGSRMATIKRNLKIYCRLIESVISRSDSIIYVLTLPRLKEELTQVIERSSLPFKLKNKLRIHTDSLDMLPPVKMAVCYPGTMSLELALRDIPHLLLAIADPLSFVIGKRVLKPNCLSLANGILAESFFLEWAGIKVSRKNFILLQRLLTKAACQPGRAAELSLKLGPSTGADMASRNCLQILNESHKKANF